MIRSSFTCINYWYPFQSDAPSMSWFVSILVYLVKRLSYQNLLSKLCSKVLIPNRFPIFRDLDSRRDFIIGSTSRKMPVKWIDAWCVIICQIYIIKVIPQILELHAFNIETIPVDLLSMKQLSFKTLAVIAITSDRA